MTSIVRRTLLLASVLVLPASALFGAAFLILPNLVADYAKWGLGWRRLIEHDRLRDALAAC